MTKVIIICGPTCVGKTRAGIELAKEFNGEIISADSGAVYKGLNIGTAKPSLKERAEIPHHLIDIIEPNESFDAAKFMELADKATNSIAKKGKTPFVVGGTGLYIRALCHGLMEAPGRDEKYRAELERIINNPPTPPLGKGGDSKFPPFLKGDKGGLQYLHEMLQEKDPLTASRLEPNDKSRIIRALEVFHLTGKSISEFQRGHGFGEKRYDALKIGLNIDRAELYKRIENRVDEMIKRGLADEVKQLIEKYGADCQAFSAVGYKEIVLASRRVGVFASDARTPERQYASTIIALIKQNTRRYAKRQLTWFRADKEIKWFDSEKSPEIKKVVAEFLQ